MSSDKTIQVYISYKGSQASLGSDQFHDLLKHVNEATDLPKFLDKDDISYYREYVSLESEQDFRGSDVFDTHSGKEDVLYIYATSMRDQKEVLQVLGAVDASVRGYLQKKGLVIEIRQGPVPEESNKVVRINPHYKPDGTDLN